MKTKRGNTIKYTIILDGIEHPALHIAQSNGISAGLFYQRILKRGWSPAEAAMIPPHQRPEGTESSAQASVRLGYHPMFFARMFYKLGLETKPMPASFWNDFLLERLNRKRSRIVLTKKAAHELYGIGKR